MTREAPASKYELASGSHHVSQPRFADTATQFHILAADRVLDAVAATAVWSI